MADITTIEITNKSVNSLSKELGKAIAVQSKTQLDLHKQYMQNISKTINKGLDKALNEIQNKYKDIKDERAFSKNAKIAKTGLKSMAEEKGRDLNYKDLPVMKLANQLAAKMNGNYKDNLKIALKEIHSQGKTVKEQYKDKAPKSELTQKKDPMISLTAMMAKSNDILSKIKETNLNILNKDVNMSPKSLGMGVLGAAAFGLLRYIGADIGGQFGGSVQAISKIGYKIATKVPQKLLDLTIKSLKWIGAKLTDDILPAIGKQAKRFVPKMNGKMIAKMIPKLGKAGKLIFSTLGKAIPIVGSLFDLYSAYKRVQRGDYKGALIDIAAGAADFIPFVGPAISIGLSLLNAGRDFKKSDEKVRQEKINENNFNLSNMTNNISKALKDAMGNWWKYTPMVGTFIHLNDAYNSINKGNTLEGFKSLAKGVVSIVPSAAYMFDIGLGVLNYASKKVSKVSEYKPNIVSMATLSGKLQEQLSEKVSNFMENSTVGKGLTSLGGFYSAVMSGDLDGSLEYLNKMTGNNIPFLKDDNVSMENMVIKTMNKKKRKMVSYVNKENDKPFEISIDNSDKDNDKREKEKINIYKAQYEQAQKTNNLLETLNSNMKNKFKNPSNVFG